MTNDNDRIRIGDNVAISRRGKRGIWTAGFTRDGKHCRQSLQTTNKKVAVQCAIKLEHDLSSGSFKAPVPATKLADAIKQYIDHLEAEGRAPKTLVRYRGELESFRKFCQERGVFRMSQVTPATLDAYRAERRSIRHVNTVAHESVVILQVFKWSENRRLIGENPLKGYRVGKPVRQPRPAPALEDLQKILAAATPRQRMLLAVLAFTGLRIGELQKLLIQDVDLTGCWIHVVSRPGAETKTRLSRKVPLHRCLQDLLQGNRRPNGPYFFSAARSLEYPEGGNAINGKKLNEQFQSFAKKFGMPVGRDSCGYTLHSLRRFFESFCVNHAVPQRAVDTWLGHRTDRSMAAVYYALSDTDSQNFMTKVPFALAAPAATEKEGNKISTE